MTVTWEGVSKNWSLPELAKDTEVDCLQNELALYNAFMLNVIYLLKIKELTYCNPIWIIRFSKLFILMKIRL